jgi:hypothetical protein
MPKIERTMSVEKILDRQEVKKDAEVLKSIVENLPSAAKVKIYKKDDDGKASFITSVPAEDFNNEKDKHEYIKNRFAKKHGGGDYYIELVDSDDNKVSSTTISLIDEIAKNETTTKSAKIMEESLEMREKAFERVKEVEEEKRKLDNEKHDLQLTFLEKQWSTIEKMYNSQIDSIKSQLEASNDKNSQEILKAELSKINNDLENRRMRFEMEVKTQNEGKASSDKMFDLMNSLIPALISKSDKEGKDPVEEFTKMFGLVEKITGGKKDLIEGMIENPEKLVLFQRMMGISSNGNGKKDFFEEMMENPMKAEFFKKVIGVEEKREKKDFFEELMENPTKAEFFKKVIGIEEKKDLFTELIENTQKFDMVRKLFGMDRQEMVIKELTDKLSSGPTVPIEPPKGFLDELVETAHKMESVKPVLRNLLGVQSTPVKSFIELIGTVINSPYLVQAVGTVMNGLTTVAMIKNGVALPGQTPQPGFAGNSSPVPQSTNQNIPPNNNKGENNDVNIEKLFESCVIKVANTNKDGVMKAEIFVEGVSNEIVSYVNNHPEAMLKILKYGGFDSITELMTKIVMPLMGITEDVARSLSTEIANLVVQKVTGKKPETPQSNTETT